MQAGDEGKIEAELKDLRAGQRHLLDVLEQFSKWVENLPPKQMDSDARLPLTVPGDRVDRRTSETDGVMRVPRSLTWGDAGRGGSKPESASALLDGIDPTVPIGTREALRDLLRRFAATFSTGETDVGRANAVRHRIDTGTNRPFRQALRRHPTVMIEAIDAQVDAMLEADLIEPAQSEWASNVVMVRKSDDSLRFCVDCWQLNERTVKD